MADTPIFGLSPDQYSPRGILPLSVIAGNDGVNRLAVEQGIPLLGQVTSFLSLEVNAQANGTVIYTVPVGQTFYAMGAQISNDNGAGYTYEWLVGQTTFKGQAPDHDSIIIGNGFPIAIAQSGETFTVVQNGNPAHGVGVVWGYLKFGTTT